MRVDLTPALAIVFYFCLAGLAVEGIGGLLGLPVDDAFSATLGTLLIGILTLGAGKGHREG